MSQLTSAPPVYTDFSGLDQLRLDAREQSPEALEEVARQFEALFIQMMLKNMRAASFGDDLFGSDQQKHYEGMFDQQMSLHLGQQGGLGLADLLVRQLGGRAGAGPDGEAVSASGSGDPLNGMPASAATATRGAMFDTPEEFVRNLRPHAVEAAERLGISPEVLLAQAALETGWGRQMMHHPDGRPSYSLFGIKADAQWDGDRVTAMTLEFESGVAVKRHESFRAYDSFADSFSDYSNYIEGSPRYRSALEHRGDPRRFITGLQQGGYATDPEYSSKINGILNSPRLTGAI